jgi:RnfABCDGE-type electron transport complex B subunit
MEQVLTAVAIMGGLGLFFAAVLALAYRYLRVEEDPRLEVVTDMLPGNNCGACGQPGCAAFAEAVLGGKATLANCTVASQAMLEDIAKFIGVDVGAADKRTARLRCAGGEGNVAQLARYEGIESCRAAVVVDGGARSCAWGCLGLADCERACTFDAITMNEQGLPVVDIEKCTACGDCVDVCPLDLFVLMPLDEHLIVQCNSPLTGDEARARCVVACDGCGRCAADAPPGAIDMVDGLPVVKIGHDPPVTQKATWRCPTGAIRWVVGQQFTHEEDDRYDRRRYA